jgi:hypothetical protein
MDKDLPEAWKLMISQKIENNLFSKVLVFHQFLLEVDSFCLRAVNSCISF